MPFRQLPATDATRITAIDAALAKAATMPALSRPYPDALHTRLAAEGPAFKAEVGEVGIALSAQGVATQQVDLHFLALQTVVSHFIQVLNLAIARGALPRAARPYYQLELESSALPPLVTRADAVLWAGRIVDGETARTDAGGPPMANPSAADVQTALATYTTSAAAQTTAKDDHDTEQEDVAALRPTIDKLIKDIWDHIEFTYREDPGPSRRRRCREWGLVYVTRPGEEPDPEEGETPENPEPPAA